ncbi:MAG TPA: hypothetical protein VFQ68_23920 [Streptosporangiaceae bacterium]|nr:hypothetical protein [Streptosporangiaceae bacterium]
MPLRQITTLVSGQLQRHVTGYHMAKLTDSRDSLRILTELALAIDTHDIPIDYQRRRDLAARATLINDTAWTTMIHEAGMRLTSISNAGRYLYELLTGGSLHTAPPPYQLTSADSQARYNDFNIGIPASMATALAAHARRLLASWGINDEPVQWQPPASWVTVTTWPGADPASTDPFPIHHALLHEDTPPAQVAADLGISPDHLRQVLRRHPLPRPRRPIRRTLIPTTEPDTPPPGQQPGILYLDPAWLREEYLTWHRSLNDIAAQLGCPVHTLNRFAREHGIPIRARGTRVFIPPGTKPGCHPSDVPEPLRLILTEHTSPQRRIRRLLMIASTPASTRPLRHSASGKAASTHKSPSSNAPAAVSSSTATPAHRAPEHSPRSASSYASKPATTSASGKI